MLLGHPRGLPEVNVLSLLCHLANYEYSREGVRVSEGIDSCTVGVSSVSLQRGVRLEQQRSRAT